jgi:hypothetical protein
VSIDVDASLTAGKRPAKAGIQPHPDIVVGIGEIQKPKGSDTGSLRLGRCEYDRYFD